MSLPVITVAQMREWEQATWAAGQTEGEVIRRVGQAVAQHALRLTQPGELILLPAGKGHNGDDVRAAQPHLADRRCELLEITSPANDLARLTDALARQPALVVDGLFGIGLNRALDAAWIQLINTLNAAHRPVLAVDVPSGLDADTGDNFGAAVRAEVTLTVGAPKRGLLRPPALEFVGRLEVADVARRGSAFRRGAIRRADVADRAARVRRHDRGRGDGAAVRLDDGLRRGLDRQAHRRVPRALPGELGSRGLAMYPTSTSLAPSVGLCFMT